MLPTGFLRGNFTAHNFTEEKVRTELFNIRIVAVAGGHADNGGCRITGIACYWQFGIPILSVDIFIQ